MEIGTVLERNYGYFPAKFRVKQSGITFKIDAIEHCWTEMRHQGQVKYHFRVRCGKTRYFLSEDIQSGHCIIGQIYEAANGKNGLTRV